VGETPLIGSFFNPLFLKSPERQTSASQALVSILISNTLTKSNLRTKRETSHLQHILGNHRPQPAKNWYYHAPRLHISEVSRTAVDPLTNLPATYPN
jgi:hypothetical protein